MADMVPFILHNITTTIIHIMEMKEFTVHHIHIMEMKEFTVNHIQIMEMKEFINALWLNVY